MLFGFLTIVACSTIADESGLWQQPLPSFKMTVCARLKDVERLVGLSRQLPKKTDEKSAETVKLSENVLLLNHIWGLDHACACLAVQSVRFAAWHRCLPKQMSSHRARETPSNPPSLTLLNLQFLLANVFLLLYNNPHLDVWCPLESNICHS